MAGMFWVEERNLMCARQAGNDLYFVEGSNPRRSPGHLLRWLELARDAMQYSSQEALGALRLLRLRRCLQRLRLCDLRLGYLLLQKASAALEELF